MNLITMLSKKRWTNVLVSILLILSLETTYGQESATATESEDVESLVDPLCEDDPYLKYLHFNANAGTTKYEGCDWVGEDPYERCSLQASPQSTNGKPKTTKKAKAAVSIVARTRAKRGRKGKEPDQQTELDLQTNREAPPEDPPEEPEQEPEQEPEPEQEIVELRSLCPLSCGLCPTAPLPPKTDTDGISGLSPEDLTTEEIEGLDLSPKELEVVEEERQQQVKVKVVKKVQKCDCPDGHDGDDENSPTAAPTIPGNTGAPNAPRPPTAEPTTFPIVIDSFPPSPDNRRTASPTNLGPPRTEPPTIPETLGPPLSTSRPTPQPTVNLNRPPVPDSTDAPTFAATAFPTFAATAPLTSSTTWTSTWTSTWSSTGTSSFSGTYSTTGTSSAPETAEAVIGAVLEGQEASINKSSTNRTLAIVLSVVPIIILLVVFWCLLRKMKQRARRKEDAADTDDNSEYGDEGDHHLRKTRSADSIGSRFMKVLGYFNGRQSDQRNDVKRCASSLCDACDEHPHQIMSIDSYENAYVMSKSDDKYEVEVEC